MMKSTLSLLVLALSGVLAWGQKPTFPGQTPVDPKSPPDLADWTPRPALGKAEPWEKMRDPDWNDPRFRSMKTGPAQNATFRHPHGAAQEFVYKGIALQFESAAVLFDRSTLRWSAGWTGGTLQHSDRRFGLLNTPTPPASARMVFSTSSTAGWSRDAKQPFPVVPKATAPYLPDQARYLGHYLHNDRAVVSYLIQGTKILDTIKPIAGQAGFIRTFRLEAHEQPIVLKLDDNRLITHPPTTKPESLFVRYGVDSGGTPDDLTELVQPGKPRWGKPLITKLERGDTTGAFAVDTLTLPYDNPHKALFFCTGLDFLADGRIALCTCHGDVWLVQVDESAGTVSWQRFATGLYHPLGLKVVKDRIVVLERGQLTRLHDTNNDGEADFYECLAHNWDTGPGEHAYDTCLETDPDGNFYFFKTGDTDLPTGGTLLKVSATGDKVSIFATGFRHPIGMGMSAQGIITGADQEGNWMPATRVDQYRQGGFYGDMRGHHRTTPPTTYDLPICWLPREVDNSAGGQVWIPKDASDWGELAGLPLHLSYGRCKPYVLLRQPVSQGNVQGGVAELGFRFLSGSCRGRFHAKEGSLYVCGLNGWQTAAKADGSLQRVRPTGKPIAVPIALEAVPGGIVLRFSQPLDKTQAENIQNYRSAAWNYRWSKDYGSKRWKPSQPNNEGQDEVVITSAKLQDERTVFLKIPTLQPVMQLQLGHNLTTQKGQPIVGMITMTLHELPKKE